MWFIPAAAQGFEDARKTRDIVARRMACEWTAKHQQ